MSRFQTTHYEVHVMEETGWTNAIPIPRSRKSALAFAQKIADSKLNAGKHIRVIKITHAEEQIKTHNRPPRTP